MIIGLKDDTLIERVGGRFRLAALIQRRMVELLQGARPLVDPKGLSDIEVVVKEIMDGKILPTEESVGEESDEVDVEV